MPDPRAIEYSGARPGDALSSYLHRTIRGVYVPRSAFRVGGLQPATGLMIQDAGAQGFMSSTGTPAASTSGALAIDWRVVTAANVRATLEQAAAVLDDNAAKFGARLVELGVVPSLSVADADAARRAAAAGTSKVPTIGRTIGSAAGAVGAVLETAIGWIVLLAILVLIGMYIYFVR